MELSSDDRGSLPGIQSNVRRLPFVDALRGWAILGVIVGHCVLFFHPANQIVFGMLLVGGHGVQLFFITSAFTLCRSAETRRGEHRPTMNFFIRRLFRIAPMFYLAAAFYLLLWGRGDAPMLSPGPYVSGAEILSTLTFTNGWGRFWQNRVVPGGWSVVVEVYFYLIFPLLFRWIRSLDSAWLFALIGYVLAVLLSDVVIYITSNQPDADIWGVFVARWLPAELPVFALGFVLHQLFKNPGTGGDGNSKFRGRLLLMTAVVLIGAAGFCQSPLFPPYLLASVGFFCFAAALAVHPKMLPAHRLIQLMGKISYSAYLVHFALLIPLRSIILEKLSGGESYLLLAIYIAVTVICTALLSTVTYRLLELPGIALGKKLIDRHESRHFPESANAQTW